MKNYFSLSLFIQIYFCLIIKSFCLKDSDSKHKKQMLIVSFDGLGKHFLSNSTWNNLRVIFGQGSYARSMRFVLIKF